MPSLGRRDIRGNAVKAKLASDLAAGALACTLAADPGASGWPTGGGLGPFTITFERGTVREERASGSARSSLAVTLSERGVDGTTDINHTAGTDVEITFSGFESDWANLHYSDQAHDHHTQYLNTTRHNAIVHTSGMLGTDSVTSTQIAANAVGSSELADASVDTNALIDLAVTAAKIANTTITAAKIANDTITATQIAADSIGSSELANASIDSTALFSGLTPFIVSGSDPGSGGNRVWFDTTNRVIKVRNSGDSGWENWLAMNGRIMMTRAPNLAPNAGTQMSGSWSTVDSFGLTATSTGCTLTRAGTYLAHLWSYMDAGTGNHRGVRIRHVRSGVTQNEVFGDTDASGTFNPNGCFPQTAMTLIAQANDTLECWYSHDAAGSIASGTTFYVTGTMGSFSAA